MFEDDKYKEFDLMMRSILDEAQEEVPAGVWEGISDSLDKTAKRKVVMLRWRRAAIGMSAAAAVAFGLMINRGNEDFVPAAGDEMIAVVEKAEETAPEDVMLAQVREQALPEHIGMTAAHKADVKLTDITVPEQQSEKAETVSDEMPSETVEPRKENEVVEPSREQTTRYPVYTDSEDWDDEDERERRKIGTSIVFSGIAGTNGTQARGANVGYIKQPSISTAPLRTGIKETSTKSNYGIPLSFGAGVKIDFTPKWSLGVGLNYTLLTRRFYGKYTKVNNEGAAEVQISTDIRNSQHYVGIPVNAFYNIVESRHLNFYTYFGGTVERCIADKYQLLGKDIVHTEKAKGVQLSANLGIGVEFLLGDYLGIYVDPSLRYYFKNGQPASIRTAQPLMLGFEMGLRVKL